MSSTTTQVIAVRAPHEVVDRVDALAVAFAKAESEERNEAVGVNRSGTVLRLIELGLAALSANGTN